MSFRVFALLAAAVVLELGLASPALAQPIAPIRPRTSPFGSIFTPGLQQQQFQQQMLLNQALGAGGVGVGVGGVPIPGLQGLGFGGLGGLGYPGQLQYQPTLPGAFATAPGLPPSGIVGTFNNYGHWYNARGTGNLGHWYPNGLANGRGILGYGGVGGGAYGASGNYGGGMGPQVGGPSRFGNSMIGNVGGTALGVGAMMNQFRR